MSGIPAFGYLTNPSKEILSELNKAKKLGVDCVELGLEPPLGTVNVLDEKRVRMKSFIEKNKFFVLGHSAYWGEYGSFYPQVRYAWIIEAKKQIAFVGTFKARKFVIHSKASGMETASGKSKKQVLNNYILSLNELCEHASAFGMKLVLENMPPGSSIYDSGDIGYIAKKVPDIGIHIDIAHAFLTGGNKFVRSFIKKSAKRLEHIHFSDNFGEHDDHIQIGKGNIDYPSVIQTLRKIGYDKTVTLEIFNGSKNAFKHSLDYVKKMWVE